MPGDAATPGDRSRRKSGGKAAVMAMFEPLADAAADAAAHRALHLDDCDELLLEPERREDDAQLGRGDAQREDLLRALRGEAALLEPQPREPPPRDAAHARFQNQYETVKEPSAQYGSVTRFHDRVPLCESGSMVR